MSVKVVADGSKDGFALASEASAGGSVALVCEGQQRDLSSVPPAGAEVELIALSDELGREITRHSTAHVLAQAVLRLYPGAKYTIGPPIENGFYYDFDVERPFTPEDLERIEAEMRKIVKENQRFEREEVEREQALQLFADQPYKIEIIEGVQSEGAQDREAGDGPVLSVYRNRDPSQDGPGSVAFIDLCRGPHLPGTGRIKAFKLLRSSGAYWRGDENKPMLQRIYGTAWESKDALQDYLHRLEEAERRDHRKIGRDLELYSWSEEVGPGLALWHPNGARSRMILEDLSRQMHLDRGYQPVFTPHIGKATLWETSGHLGFFRENMFPPMEADEGEYFAKPMNCPFHILIYRSRTRSYRELPVRLFELGTVYRYERSGTVHGILRARGLTMDDAHIFCRPDQVVDELVDVVGFLRDLYGTVGLSPDAVRFSTKPDKAVGSPELWTLAEDAIKEGLTTAGLDYTISQGEGAFYGPKIDVDVRDAIGRYWQVCTIQVDFQEPDRFGLEYIDENGERQRPVMLHRALFGSVERFFGVLVEHFAGAFPTWLAPVQVAIIPIADRHSAYAREVGDRLQAARIRAEIDDSADTMGAKIRRNQMHKVPYMLVVGDNETSSTTVSVRRRTGEEIRGVGVDDLVTKLTAEIESRSLELTL
ncbi:MAG: threonyl-tRNA synthetase [Actinomycetota bacterium]|jgi:threonyl-tRNA synthetase|nr:threonyl-tRNA synthetase [Actinomycetota bacterium]